MLAIYKEINREGKIYREIGQIEGQIYREIEQIDRQKDRYKEEQQNTQKGRTSSNW